MIVSAFNVTIQTASRPNTVNQATHSDGERDDADEFVPCS